MSLKNIKNKFSIFENYRRRTEEDLIYLDSASTSLTPDPVVEKLVEYYQNYRSNVDRGNSLIAKVAGREFTDSKKKLAKYLNTSEENLIWTSGSTEASNNLLQMISQSPIFNLSPGDEILTTVMEHHSTLLPLQKLAKEKGLQLKFLELDSYFDLDLRKLEGIITPKTKIVSITSGSNVLGTINDLTNIIRKIKTLNPNIFVISDLTTAFGHLPLDLEKLSPYLDAGYFSLHKAFGTTGVGVLYLKRNFSRIFEPVKIGGGMVAKVERESFAPRSDLQAHEAGTQNLAGIIATSEAINFLNTLEDSPLEHNQKLVEYFLKKVKEFNTRFGERLEIKVYAAMEHNNLGIISFQLKKDGQVVNPHELSEILSANNISVRSGHHCCEPLMEYLHTLEGLTRISFQIYNTREDIDKLLAVLAKV